MKESTYRYRIVRETNGCGRDQFFVEYRGWFFWYRWSNLFPVAFNTEEEARKKVHGHLAYLKATKIVARTVVPPEIVETF